MARRSISWTDAQTEAVIGTLLRGGVLLAGAVVVLGGAVYLTRHAFSTPEYHAFRGTPADLRTVPGIARAALELRGRGIIQLGLVLLIATPVTRVIFAVIGFALEKDWLYVGVASMVLAILAFSLAGGHF